MKKIIIYLILFLIANITFAQTEFDHPVLSKNTNATELINNINGIIWSKDSIISSKGITDDWFIKKKELFLSKDNKGNTLSSKNIEFNDSLSRFIPLDSTSYSYYESNQLKETLTIIWNQENNSWADTVGYSKFDLSGNIIIKMSKTWKSFDKIYSGFKDLYFYGVEGKLDTNITMKVINNEKPTKYRKHVYIYNDNNLLLNNITSFWDNESNNWKKTYKLTNKYKNGDLIEDIIQDYNKETATWTDSQKNTFKNDDNHNRTQHIYQSMNSDLKWMNIRMYQFTFKNNNRSTNFKSKWDNEKKEWYYYRKYFYEYDSNNNNI